MLLQGISSPVNDDAAFCFIKQQHALQDAVMSEPDLIHMQALDKCKLIHTGSQS
ncbi:hypothetical protein D3C71_2097490 [compost metagenome]